MPYKLIFCSFSLANFEQYMSYFCKVVEYFILKVRIGSRIENNGGLDRGA